MREALLSRLSAESVRYVLPDAPGQSWYDAKAVAPPTPETETQLSDALGRVAEAVAVARSECAGVPLVLIGFSQGACLVAEYLMRGDRADMAAMLTGCRVGAVSDALPTAQLDGMPIYCANGNTDPWIPPWAFDKAVAGFVAMGARVRSDVFPGRPHEISAGEIAEIDRMLVSLCEGRPVFGPAP